MVDVRCRDAWRADVGRFGIHGAGPMTDALFWFLVSQTLTGLPAMAPGTEVRVVSPNLLTIHAIGRVVRGALVFESTLPIATEVRILVFPPGASATELAQTLSGATALHARVSTDGSDLFVSFSEAGGYLSFRKWLAEERGLELTFWQGASD